MDGTKWNNTATHFNRASCVCVCARLHTFHVLEYVRMRTTKRIWYTAANNVVCFFPFACWLVFFFSVHSVDFILFVLTLLNMVGWLFHDCIFHSCSVAAVTVAYLLACLSHLGYLNSSLAWQLRVYVFNITMQLIFLLSETTKAWFLHFSWYCHSLRCFVFARNGRLFVRLDSFTSAMQCDVYVSLSGHSMSFIHFISASVCCRRRRRHCRRLLFFPRCMIALCSFRILLFRFEISSWLMHNTKCLRLRSRMVIVRKYIST